MFCTELCPILVTTIIHRCLNCAETYCLLCTHEHGCCLTCEADTEAWASAPSVLLMPSAPSTLLMPSAPPMPLMPCNLDADYAVSSERPSDSLLQTPAETSTSLLVSETPTDMLAVMPAKSPPQFKIPSAIPKNKCVRS